METTTNKRVLEAQKVVDEAINALVELRLDLLTREAKPEFQEARALFERGYRRHCYSYRIYESDGDSLETVDRLLLDGQQVVDGTEVDYRGACPELEYAVHASMLTRRQAGGKGEKNRGMREHVKKVFSYLANLSDEEN